jgi:HD-like signal output (HDOD) protein
VELNTEYAEGAFTAGLLQNVGLVLIAIGLPDEYAIIQQAYQTGTGGLADYEDGFIGVSHADLSGEVLTRWHLPAPICKAVARHHGPHEGGAQHPLSRMVELADTMAEQQGALAQPWMRKPEGNPANILASLGLENKAAGMMDSFSLEYQTISAFFG